MPDLLEVANPAQRHEKDCLDSVELPHPAQALLQALRPAEAADGPSQPAAGTPWT